MNADYLQYSTQMRSTDVQCLQDQDLDDWEVELTNVIPGQSDMEKLSGDCHVYLHPWRPLDTVLLCDMIPRADLTRCSSQMLRNKCLVSHPTTFKRFFNSWDFPFEVLPSTPQKRKSFLWKLGTKGEVRGTNLSSALQTSKKTCPMNITRTKQDFRLIK